MMASLIFFMASFLQILHWDRNNNLSLGFRVGNFHDNGLIDIIFDSYFPFLSFNKNINLSLEFRVGKFREGGLLNIDFVFFHIAPKNHIYRKFENISNYVSFEKYRFHK